MPYIGNTDEKGRDNDVWYHDGDTMRKFAINDRVRPRESIRSAILSREAASWGPNKKVPPDEASVYLIANSVRKKVFGSTKWFHEISAWTADPELDDDAEMLGYYGPVLASDMALEREPDRRDGSPRD